MENKIFGIFYGKHWIQSPTIEKKLSTALAAQTNTNPGFLPITVGAPSVTMSIVFYKEHTNQIIILYWRNFQKWLIHWLVFLLWWHPSLMRRIFRLYFAFLRTKSPKQLRRTCFGIVFSLYVINSVCFSFFFIRLCWGITIAYLFIVACFWELTRGLMVNIRLYLHLLSCCALFVLRSLVRFYFPLICWIVGGLCLRYRGIRLSFL